MANWKKMAEAFGRGFGQSKGPIKEDLNNAELSTLKAFGKHKDDAIGDEFRSGARGGTQDRISAEARAETAQDEGARGSLDKLTDEELDHINDVRTDDQLREDFDKGFEDAVVRRKGKSGINRSYLESRGLSPEEIDQIDTDENRRILIDLLKKNQDTGDVLRNFGED